MAGPAPEYPLRVIRDAARQLRGGEGESSDVDAIVARIGDARVVLLGEASHGTHEFYATRAAVTRRLVEPAASAR